MRDSIGRDGRGPAVSAADQLHEQAQRCRRLAQSVADSRTVDALTAMASEYEEQARALKLAN